jgi:uncharacterized protein
MSWVSMSGRATLFTWVVVHHGFLPSFRDKVPFVPGLVCLEEDRSIRVVTTIVDCRAEDLVAGMPVSVVFRPLTFTGVDREVLAPLFKPDDRSVAPRSAPPDAGR